MMREHVDHLLAILHSTRVDFLAKHVFRIGIVQSVVELEIRVHARPVNRPAGEAPRHFGDVLLRVAAVDAEGV